MGEKCFGEEQPQVSSTREDARCNDGRDGGRDVCSHWCGRGQMLLLSGPPQTKPILVYRIVPFFGKGSLSPDDVLKLQHLQKLQLSPRHLQRTGSGLLSKLSFIGPIKLVWGKDLRAAPLTSEEHGKAWVYVTSRPTRIDDKMPGTPVSSALVVALHLQYPTLVLSLFMFNTTNMRFSIVAAVLFLARAVYSQSISQDTAQLPSCSLSCLSNAIISVGCSLTDYVCQCGAHRAAIAAQGVPCIVNSCNTTEALSESMQANATVVPRPNSPQLPKRL